MEFGSEVDFKSVVFGAAFAAACAILGTMYNDMLYAFASIGFLYVGYQAKNIKMGAFLGAFASTPLIYLALDGKLGYIPDESKMIMTVAILLVGAFVGTVGAWAKRSREKAKVEYAKKQKIGKNKKKNKKDEVAETETKTGLLNKISKKNKEK